MTIISTILKFLQLKSCLIKTMFPRKGLYKNKLFRGYGARILKT